MNKIKTNIFQDSAGKKFDATENVKGIVETWGTDDVVSQINGPVSAEAITDGSGNLVKFRYFATSFSKIQDRKALVTKDMNGDAIKADPIKAEEITVELDDERSIGPDYIDNWDADKLANRINLKASKNGQYAILSKNERAERFFDALRRGAKAADAATPGDGVTRIIDTTSVTDDVKLTKLLQNAGDELVAQKNSRRKGTPRQFLFYALTPKTLTKVSNTQAFTGSNAASQNLSEGAVGKLNGIEVFENIHSDIDFCAIKGAAVVPIGNPEIVEYPAKSNAIKIAFEYALPKAGSEGILYADGIVALGDPVKIKA